MRLVLYITKSWSVPLIIATLLSSHIIHLFFIFSFLYLNFSSPYFQKKKKKRKKKKLFFSLIVHISTVTLFPIFPFPFCLFIVILHSSFLYFDSSSTYFILYNFDIVFTFNPYFSRTKLWVLSLSLSLSLSMNFCSFL